MQNLIPFNFNNLNALVKTREGETKFGEHVQVLNNLTNIYDDIISLDVNYVIFGISEAIGVLANFGKTGTYNAWNANIKILLNTQSNAFLNAKRILILGHLDYKKEQKEVQNKSLSQKKRIALAKYYTEKIDEDVSHVMFSIIKAGKIPIVIGGGHNNAYGNIKGTSLALKQKINVINFDAHHDFRPLEGRHSGNGFSYAYNEGFLNKYFIFGIHENYISQNSLNTLKQTKEISFNTFEDIAIRKKTIFKTELKRSINHVSDTSFGIEIDCDAIENIPSSAMTPSGFSVTKARQFVIEIGKNKNVKYLHICEAAPTKKTETQVGKLISYLITDFIKANGN